MAYLKFEIKDGYVEDLTEWVNYLATEDDLERLSRNLFREEYLEDTPYSTFKDFYGNMTPEEFVNNGFDEAFGFLLDEVDEIIVRFGDNGIVIREDGTYLEEEWLCLIYQSTLL